MVLLSDLFAPTTALIIGILCGFVPFLACLLSGFEYFRKKHDIPARIAISPGILKVDGEVYSWAEIQEVILPPPAATGKGGTGERVLSINVGKECVLYNLGPCARRGTLKTIFTDYGLLYARLETMAVKKGFLLIDIDLDNG